MGCCGVARIWQLLRSIETEANQTSITTKRVVMIGLEPDVVDYSDPAHAIFPGVNAEVLREALEKELCNVDATVDLREQLSYTRGLPAAFS